MLSRLFQEKKRLHVVLLSHSMNLRLESVILSCRFTGLGVAREKNQCSLIPPRTKSLRQTGSSADKSTKNYEWGVYFFNDLARTRNNAHLSGRKKSRRPRWIFMKSALVDTRWKQKSRDVSPPRADQSVGATPLARGKRMCKHSVVKYLRPSTSTTEQPTAINNQ